MIPVISYVFNICLVLVMRETNANFQLAGGPHFFFIHDFNKNTYTNVYVFVMEIDYVPYSPHQKLMRNQYEVYWTS